MTDVNTGALMEAALDYARRGWPVLPLHTWTQGTRCSCSVECSSPAKHPRLPNGLHGASTNLDVIAGWWKRWPTANVGLRTGVSFDVLDVDGQEGSDSVVTLCEAEQVVLPTGPWAKTGGGGDHLLFLPTGAGNRAGILPSVDWRGQNGYIVAPPSLHRSGMAYAWEEGPDTPLQEVPPWLASIVSPPRVERPPSPPRTLPAGSGDGTPYGLSALDAELAELSRAPVGMRNHSLNTTAFNLYQLVAGGELVEGVVASRLQQVGVGIGLSELEVRTTIESAHRAGMQEPRSAPELRVVGGTTATARVAASNGSGTLRAVPNRDEANGSANLSGIKSFDQRVGDFEDLLIAFDDLEHRPVPQYLVKELIVAGSLAGIYGPRGSGKSFLAMDLAAHIACGAWWQKRKVVAGRVMYVAAEGLGGLPKRVAAWKAHNRIHQVPEFSIYPQAVNLLDPIAVAVVAEVAKRRECALTIFDTVARSMPGGDENSAKDMGILIESADHVRTQSAGAVLLVHHTGKDASLGMRGSSALEAALDTVLEVRGTDGQFEVHCAKQKDDAPFSPISLALSVVELQLPDGRLTSSCAVTGSPLEQLETYLSEHKIAEARRLVFQLASSTGISGAEMLKVFEERLGLRKSAGYEMRNVLVREGVIVNKGTERQPFYVLGEKEAF